ncbi:hypothetical protein AnigIFM62618_011694 [Aspergillus niger]|nr:hypothetical protein AnigIFM62618_011694 [Aspergillus niger]
MGFEQKVNSRSPNDVNIEIGAVQVDLSADEEKRMVKKIDCFILPLSLSYVYASVFGLIDDLDLQGSEYSWCSSLFYLGQLVAEYPFIYLMSRLPLTKFVGGTM